MLRAELLSLASTTSARITAVLAVAGLLATQITFVSLLPAIVRGDVGAAEGAADDMPAFDLASGATQLDALSPLGASMSAGSVGIAILAVVILGVLAGTSDYRFGGIVTAALAAPRRWQLVAAKAGASGLAGIVLGATLVAVSAVVLAITLAVAGAPFAIDGVAAAAVLARGVVAIACLVLIGLAVGLLTRSQLGGVLVVLTVMLTEPLITAVAGLATGTVPVWTQLLPVALAHATIGAGPAQLSPLVAGGILVGLTLVVLAAATIAVRRRDI